MLIASADTGKSFPSREEAYPQTVKLIHQNSEVQLDGWVDARSDNPIVLPSRGVKVWRPEFIIWPRDSNCPPLFAVLVQNGGRIFSWINLMNNKLHTMVPGQDGRNTGSVMFDFVKAGGQKGARGFKAIKRTDMCSLVVLEALDAGNGCSMAKSGASFKIHYASCNVYVAATLSNENKNRDLDSTVDSISLQDVKMNLNQYKRLKLAHDAHAFANMPNSINALPAGVFLNANASTISSKQSSDFLAMLEEISRVQKQHADLETRNAAQLGLLIGRAKCVAQNSSFTNVLNTLPPTQVNIPVQRKGVVRSRESLNVPPVTLPSVSSSSSSSSSRAIGNIGTSAVGSLDNLNHPFDFGLDFEPPMKQFGLPDTQNLDLQLNNQKNVFGMTIPAASDFLDRAEASEQEESTDDLTNQPPPTYTSHYKADHDHVMNIPQDQDSLKKKKSQYYLSSLGYFRNVHWTTMLVGLMLFFFAGFFGRDFYNQSVMNLNTNTVLYNPHEVFSATNSKLFPGIDETHNQLLLSVCSEKLLMNDKSLFVDGYTTEVTALGHNLRIAISVEDTIIAENQERTNLYHVVSTEPSAPFIEAGVFDTDAYRGSLTSCVSLLNNYF